MPTSHDQLERDEAAEHAQTDEPEPNAPVTTELPGDHPASEG